MTKLLLSLLMIGNLADKMVIPLIIFTIVWAICILWIALSPNYKSAIYKIFFPTLLLLTLSFIIMLKSNSI